MTTVSLPPNEVERLEALRRYNILDTPPEETFNRITTLAARLFNVPMALADAAYPSTAETTTRTDECDRTNCLRWRD